MAEKVACDTPDGAPHATSKGYGLVTAQAYPGSKNFNLTRSLTEAFAGWWREMFETRRGPG